MEHGLRRWAPDSYQSTLNIQPVIPITLNKDWNLITRTIFPIESWPAPCSDTHVAGIGDMTFSMFLSPANSGKFVWGVGPAFLFPTASSSEVGSGEWGLANNRCSLHGQENRGGRSGQPHLVIRGLGR